MVVMQIVYDFEMNDAINYAYSYSNNSFSKAEIKKTINSAYENNINEKGRLAILPNLP